MSSVARKCSTAANMTVDQLCTRLGAFAISFGLPIGCYAASLLCNDVSGCPATSVLHPSTLTLDKLKADIGWKGWSALFNWQAFAANLGWFVLSLILYRTLPATEAEGTVLRSGGRIKYRFNGMYRPNMEYIKD